MSSIAVSLSKWLWWSSVLVPLFVSWTEWKHRTERDHGLNIQSLRGPCQILQHLRDWIHLTDWNGTLRSYPLLMSPELCRHPWRSPSHPPALEASCLQIISDSGVVRVCSDSHTSLRLCEKWVPFLPLNGPQLCGLWLLTSSSVHIHIHSGFSFLIQS